MSPSAVDCEAVIRELWDWLDGELAPDRLDDIRAHLESCTGCAAHERFAASFLRQVAEAPLKANDLETLRARIKAALAQNPHPAP